ncbi:MAG: hypothetical protein Q4D06_02335 [Coriobacteriia bacterium]|nr:hypothetical protein [Coriobacteriia bacterium]
MRKTLAGIALSLAMALGVMAAPAWADEITVSTGGTVRSFEAALAQASDGDTIRLDGTVATEQLSSDAPLVIGKAVTVTGGQLTVNNAGIVLGADVTFRDTSIKMANAVRNAIVANGHTLRMSNVTDPQNDKFRIHLFCGGLSDYKESLAVPAVGPAGAIYLDGKVEVGNVYCGGLSDVSSASYTEPLGSNSFAGTAYVCLEEGLSSSSLIGNIYGSGAREVRGAGDGDALVADPERYTAASGTVVLKPRDGFKSVVLDGRTGNKNLVLSYEPNPSNTYARGFAATDYVSELRVVRGQYVLKCSSAATLAGTDLMISDGACLDMTEAPQNVTVKGIAGGQSTAANLIMAENGTQTITATDSTSGTARVAMGNMNFPNPVVLDHPYIVAPKTAEGTFVLVPKSIQANLQFLHTKKGQWLVPSADFEDVDDPDTPVDPDDPSDPKDPVDPKDPSDPTDPADPTDPVNPGKPEGPKAISPTVTLSTSTYKYSGTAKTPQGDRDPRRP